MDKFWAKFLTANGLDVEDLCLRLNCGRIYSNRYHLFLIQMLLLVLSVAMPVSMLGQSLKDEGKRLVIVSAAVDPSKGNHLKITGFFHSVDTPLVMLNRIRLTVLSFNDTEIIALLPNPLPSSGDQDAQTGSYLLEVFRFTKIGAGGM